MDEFSYLSVLVSVILGLAVTQILKGFRGILLSRGANCDVLARAWMGESVAFAVRAALVGDVRHAAATRLDF